jgi:hypothetical protein
MFSNPSEKVRECLEHAEDCARKAAAQPDGSSLRQDFRDMEKRWLSLARSIEYTERLMTLSEDAPPKLNGIPFRKS